ncbi:HpcH/HpaI aldolase/citrate lyase family protein [Aquimarina rubra]|uniref:HpcH/HpaI aldolase/citrate lyase family protein n=1 Tax=Aquimarina rubra TaxID=1920033 RepID=A0ABW5LFK8_9FLAO
MLDSYFFVPANNKRFIEKSKSLVVDHMIFDLEDAVASSELEEALKNLKNLSDKKNCWVRPPLFVNEQIDNVILQKSLNIGFNKFVFPKVSAKVEMLFLEKWIIEQYGDNLLDKIEVILLVENPNCLLELEKILESKLNIVAVSLGSHDYCNAMSMKHIRKNLDYSKHKILNIARANGIMFLDSPSMNIKNKEIYTENIEEAFSLGCDGIMTIHPNQLKWINEFPFYSEEEIETAKTIWQNVLQIGENNFSVIKLDGQVYERPHLNRIKKIINWANTHESK